MQRKARMWAVTRALTRTLLSARRFDPVGLLVLSSLTVGCFSTGPAHRVEDFKHLALQLDSRPQQVLQAGRVQWVVGAESEWDVVRAARKHAQATCEVQKARYGGWCFATGYISTGVFLMTDDELAFFRWDEDHYVVEARVRYEDLEAVRLERRLGFGAPYLILEKDGEPLLLYVLVNSVIVSHGGTGALYEALMEHVPWGQHDGTATVGAHDPTHPSGALINQQSEQRIHLDIEYPPNDAVVGDAACGTFVGGRAIATQSELRDFDVMFVLDTSRSTIGPSGADINDNGLVGEPDLVRAGSVFDVQSTDLGDSILSAEVAAARQILRDLDPRSTRVGVVAFAGDPPDAHKAGLFGHRPRPPASTLEPLTNDYSRVERALDDTLARNPEGSTDMAAGIDQATLELSRPSAGSERIVLFFTDGQPTLPYGPRRESENVRAVLQAADRARADDIRIHSFAIGPDALDGPLAAVEMAQRTGGLFTPVRHPGDLVDVVEEVSFANLEEVSLKSLTTGEPAEHFSGTADGSWAGLVRLQPGRNEIEIAARASDESAVTRRVSVTMVEDRPEPPIASDLVAARNRLLEECLRGLKQVRASAERERARQVRKDLLVEIDRERGKAQQRATEQRKQLHIEVEQTR